MYLKKDYASNYLAISIILDRDIYSTDTFDKIISNTDNTGLLGYPLLDSSFGRWIFLESRPQIPYIPTKLFCLERKIYEKI